MWWREFIMSTNPPIDLSRPTNFPALVATNRQQPSDQVGKEKVSQLKKAQALFLPVSWMTCLLLETSLLLHETLYTSFLKIIFTFKTCFYHLFSLLSCLYLKNSTVNVCHKPGVSAVIMSSLAHQVQSVTEFTFPLGQSLLDNTHLKAIAP